MHKRPRANDEPKLLPLDYKAGPFVVMIGRGRRCLQNEGNKRFRVMVKDELQAYSAGRKAKKSSIIKRILREIRSQCEDGIGFVKQDALTGRYYTATTTAAKVTIAQAFRDALHDSGYKSSKQHKQFKRDVARGKVDPTTCTPEMYAAGMCQACKDELQPLQQASASELGEPHMSPNHVAPKEPSLQFWRDSLDPLIEFEHSHPPACHEGVEGLPPLTGSAACASHKADPFEPIPLDTAMKLHAGVSLLHTDQDEDMDSSETSSDTPGLDDTDDEEDHAMVAWATEFVHCPRCSVIQGRGDFNELPIHDIRKSLIGLNASI